MHDRESNEGRILVTLHDGVPVPKVIDFGIAKATSQQRLTDKTLFTAFDATHPGTRSRGRQSAQTLLRFADPLRS
jgi:hypothetical protein